jgi:hypothetical protein
MNTRHIKSLVAAALGLITVAFSQSANAAWTIDGTYVASSEVHFPSILIKGAVSDQSGGAIIVWPTDGVDSRVRAKRLGPTGNAVWFPGAVEMGEGNWGRRTPRMASDGAGGAIVVWQDYRSGVDIYAQRVDASGNPLWTATGIPICTAPNENFLWRQIIEDGSGGAIVVWTDRRNPANYYDIYAQRVDGAGNVLWTTDGVPVFLGVGYQAGPLLASDGSGGAIIAWDDRATSIASVRCQRINGSGAVVWPIETTVAQSDSAQGLSGIVSDGAGGAYALLVDARSGTGDVYAQRIDGAGNRLWNAAGVAVCAAADEQFYATLTRDQAGGYFACWSDLRSGTQSEIYAQRVNTNGQGLWTADGIVVCDAAQNQFVPDIASDGLGGVLVSWFDYRSSPNADIYAQRVNSAGTTLWTDDGVPICTATNAQEYPLLVPDGAGAAIVVWGDRRNGLTADVYAQRVDANGVVDPTVAVGNTPVAGILQVFDNTPNPFSASSTLRISLSMPSDVTMEVYDVAGKRVSMSRLEGLAAGEHALALHGRATNGTPLSSGVYFCRVSAHGETATRKIVVQR